MAQKNWKEKLNDMGIEIKEVRRTDGSVIDGWYTFEHKGLPVFTYAMNNQRTYQVGVPPFPPYADEYKSDVKGRFASTNFDHFMAFSVVINLISVTLCLIPNISFKYAVSYWSPK